MASVYTRPETGFFWLKYKNEQGIVVRKSTKLRTSNPVDVRAARALEAEYTMKEFSQNPNGKTPSEPGWDWVLPFLRTRYRTKSTTLERYEDAWNTILLFLHEKKITLPAHLTRQLCFNYVDWRQHPDKRKGKYKACHNTALLELKILRVIMTEAVVRKLCNGNPCVKLEIHRDPPHKAPELSDAQVNQMREKISEVADPFLKHFLAVSFEIGHYQGFRVNETRLNLKSDIRIFSEVKMCRIRVVGKGRKESLTLMHPLLIPIFKDLRSKGHQFTWDPPAETGRTWASTTWTRFLNKSGLKDLIPHVCFRSHRMTVATVLARNNVSLSKAKEYLRHASTTVHFGYQSLSLEDLSDCADQIL